MRYAFLVLIALMNGSPAAQTNGVYRGLFVGTATWTKNALTAPCAVGELSPSKQLTLSATSSAGPWVYQGQVLGAVQDVDNNSVLILAFSGSDANHYRHTLIRWDPTARAVLGTLWSSHLRASPALGSSNTTLDSDGNLVAYANASGVDQMVTFDRMSGTWSGVALGSGPISKGDWTVGGLEWDRLRGGFVHANGWSVGAGSVFQHVFRTAWDRSTTTTLVTARDAPAHSGGALLQNGDWVSSSRRTFARSAQVLYYELKAGSSTWAPGPAAPAASFTDVTAEKFAAPGRGYYAAILDINKGYGLAYVDATTTPHTVGALWGPSTLPAPVPAPGVPILEVLPLYERDLCTVRTGKGTWAVLVNPGKGSFGGRTFVVAASLSGARPAVRLPDGREIFLVPDAFTTVSVAGPVPPFLTGNVGVLGPTGLAHAVLDFSVVEKSLNGVTVNLCGVVLDPAAPSGISWVLDPWAFVVNVLP
jgi:hypothetical protein